MQNTIQHPAALTAYLERLNPTELLTAYIDRARVHRVANVSTLEVMVNRYGYRVARQGGNLYGRLLVTPTSTTPAPVLQIVTRSDVAALYGSGKRVA